MSTSTPYSNNQRESDAPTATAQCGPTRHGCGRGPSSTRPASSRSYTPFRRSWQRNQATPRASPSSGPSATNIAIPSPTISTNTGMPIQKACSRPEGTWVPAMTNGSASTGQRDDRRGAQHRLHRQRGRRVGDAEAGVAQHGGLQRGARRTAAGRDPVEGVAGELRRHHREPVAGAERDGLHEPHAPEASDRAQRRGNQPDRFDPSEAVVRGEDLGDARREQVEADRADGEERDPAHRPVRVVAVDRVRPDRGARCQSSVVPQSRTVRRRRPPPRSGASPGRAGTSSRRGAGGGRGTRSAIRPPRCDRAWSRGRRRGAARPPGRRPGRPCGRSPVARAAAGARRRAAPPRAARIGCGQERARNHEKRKRDDERRHEEGGQEARSRRRGSSTPRCGDGR